MNSQTEAVNGVLVSAGPDGHVLREVCHVGTAFVRRPHRRFTSAVRVGAAVSGTVYRARDTFLGGRIVVLTVLHADLADDPDWVRRSQHEESIGAILDHSGHPGDVPVRRHRRVALHSSVVRAGADAGVVITIGGAFGIRS